MRCVWGIGEKNGIGNVSSALIPRFSFLASHSSLLIPHSRKFVTAEMFSHVLGLYLSQAQRNVNFRA